MEFSAKAKFTTVSCHWFWPLISILTPVQNKEGAPRLFTYPRGHSGIPSGSTLGKKGPGLWRQRQKHCQEECGRGRAPPPTPSKSQDGYIYIYISSFLCPLRIGRCTCCLPKKHSPKRLFAYPLALIESTRPDPFLRSPIRHRLNRAPPGLTRIHQIPPELTRTQRNPPEPIRIHQNPIPELTKSDKKDSPETTRTHRNSPESTGTPQNS